MEVDIENIVENRIHQIIYCFEKRLLENSNKEKWFCKLTHCSASLSDKSCAIRHVRLNHRDIYDAIQSNKKFAKDSELGESSFEVRVRVDIKSIEEACIELITKNALPLRFVEFPAFKKIIEPYEIALKRQGTPFSITPEKMNLLIKEKAERIKKQIIDETKGRYVSVMLDIASRLNRSILGINIRYMDSSGYFVIRTIGMQCLRLAHNGENIRDTVLEILAKYDITKAMLFSITSDNGLNLIKAIALIDADYQKEKLDEQLVNGHLSAEDSDFDIDCDIFDTAYYGDLLTNTRFQFDQLQYNDLIHGVSCAAHCFHLIVNKSIEGCEQIDKLIQKCRELSKKLRTPTFRQQIDLAKLNHAKVDIATRWNSIYLMLLRLFELREFCLSLTTKAEILKKIKDYLLTEDEWRSVEQLILILKPFYEYTIKLQSKDCTLSDFYGYWLAISHKMRGISHHTEFVEKLRYQMSQYKNQLLENTVLVSAVYLDPRYQRSLSKEKRDSAIFFLSGLFEKAVSLESKNDTSSQHQQIDSIQTNDDFIAYMDSLGSFGITTTHHEPETDNLITTLLKKFDGIQMNLNKSVLKFWYENKTSQPELWRLSSIIHGVPPTQTSIERAFSAFPLILTPRRNRISDEVLQNILLVRLNN